MSLLFVGAIASAAITEVVAAHASIDDSVVQQQVQNILMTAKAINELMDLILGPLELHEEEPPRARRGDPKKYNQQQQDPQRPQPQPQTQQRPASPLDKILAMAVKDVLPLSKPGSEGGPTPTPPAASSGEAAAGASASLPATSAGAGRAPTPAGSLPAPPTAAPAAPPGGAGGGGLPLPASLTQAVLSRLDASSAAAASASCAQLAAAHHSLATFRLSSSFQAYLTALHLITRAAVQDGYSDGSTESEFYVQFPLDGCPAAGLDLREDAYNRRMVGLALMMEGTRLGANGHAEAMRAECQAKVKTVRAPHPSSSPLAAFKDSRAVARRNSITPPAPSDSSSAFTPASASTSPPASTSRDPGCLLSEARCDVQRIELASYGCKIHCDGGLLSLAHLTGWKQRDPALTAMALRPLQRVEGKREKRRARRAEAEAEVGPQEDYNTGFFGRVNRVCSDSANGLIWAAGDDGSRIKAFRAPQPASTRLAGCNRGQPNGMSLQYTLCSDVRGLPGRHAGLNVLGSRVINVKGSGAVLLWDISELPAQLTSREPRSLSRAHGQSSDDEEDEEDDDEDDEGEYRGWLGFRDTEDPSELEVTKGHPPHQVLLLPQYDGAGGGPAAAAAGRRGPFQGSDDEFIRHSALLADAAAPTCPSIAAALGGSNMILTWDLATQKLRQCLFGHLYDITDLAAPPPAWGAAHLFASCAQSGDVKVWDTRLYGGGAAVTLLTGGSASMNAVALASTSGGGGGGGMAAGTLLGAGMLCFAGGAGEAVWAWDLRGGSARPLYELSTGNTVVRSLAWDDTTCSLFAVCESLFEDRMGNFDRSDWRRVQVRGGGGNAGAGGSADDGEGDEDDDDDDDGEYYPGREEGVRKRLWPIRAAHQPDSFRRFFSMPEPGVLRYHFSPGASRAVPRSEAPCFASW